MLDSNIVAGYRRAIARRPTPVIVRRITGVAPNATTDDVCIDGIVTDYIPKAPVANVTPEGAITLGARFVVLLGEDLVAQGFELPVAKNDKVVVGGEELNIMSVDPYKRALAGAIEIVAEGV